APVPSRATAMGRWSAAICGTVASHNPDYVADAIGNTNPHAGHTPRVEQKKMLLEKACAALPPGGAVIVLDSIIDDDRSRNAFGLTMSLNIVIETAGG